ncbi:MAG: carbonic anhydrase [Myxococcota bacterium]
MQKLLEGHTSFRREYASGARDFLSRLAAEHQSPDALYVGCSDSRVVPELLTTSSPGDLFVVRNIANVVPPFDHADASVGAALEYAVNVLEVPHVIVCGHYGCGGVKAVLDHAPKVRKLPSLREWLDGIERSIDASRLEALDPDEQWRYSVEANVLAQLANLTTYPTLRERLEAEALRLHGWVYDLASQRITVYDAVGETFVDAERILG